MNSCWNFTCTLCSVSVLPGICWESTGREGLGRTVGNSSGKTAVGWKQVLCCLTQRVMDTNLHFLLVVCLMVYFALLSWWCVSLTVYPLLLVCLMVCFALFSWCVRLMVCFALFSWCLMVCFAIFSRWCVSLMVCFAIFSRWCVSLMVCFALIASSLSKWDFSWLNCCLHPTQCMLMNLWTLLCPLHSVCGLKIELHMAS